MRSSKIIVGNWKMNPTSLEKAQTIFKGIEKGLKPNKKVVSIICPAFPHLVPLIQNKKRKSLIGAQNVFAEVKGSFTGEVSIDMLKDLGVSHIILGHSERRKLGESDELINKKVLLALSNKITPIICIGETARDEDGHFFTVLTEQLKKAFAGVSQKQAAKVIIAYEPVWAIGATEAMSPHDIFQTTLFIRKVLMELYKVKSPMNVPVLYGGAVDPINAHSILTEGYIDGLLIGRQSLEPQSFLEIIRLAQNL